MLAMLAMLAMCTKPELNAAVAEFVKKCGEQVPIVNREYNVPSALKKSLYPLWDPCDSAWNILVMRRACRADLSDGEWQEITRSAIGALDAWLGEQEATYADIYAYRWNLGWEMFPSAERSQVLKDYREALTVHMTELDTRGQRVDAAKWTFWSNRER